MTSLKIFFICALGGLLFSCNSKKAIADQTEVAQKKEILDISIDQNKKPPPPPPPPPQAPSGVEKIFKVVEQMPRFPGCEDKGSEKEKKACATEELLKFIYRHLEYPINAKENGIEGICIVTFVIEKDGSVSTVKLVRGIGFGCDEEAVRVVSLMNKMNIRWTPQRSRSRNVRVQFNLPVEFKLPEND